MTVVEHFPDRTVTLLPGDEIRATYKQPKGSPFSANTLKRLFGWKNDQRYIGRVRHIRKGEDITESSYVVDFFDVEKGKRQSTHVVYNVELQIAKGELTDLRYIPNPSPSLFDDER